MTRLYPCWSLPEAMAHALWVASGIAVGSTLFAAAAIAQSAAPEATPLESGPDVNVMVSADSVGPSANPANPAEAGWPASAADSTTPAAQEDLAARRYLNTCAGCHSLAGAKLNGPALSHVATWSREQIEPALRRMEKNVGPLSPADIDLLTGFLQAPDNQERLAREQERIRAEFAAKMSPPDAALGGRLFHGKVTLENGGLACFACHRFEGSGGRLGPDLGDAGVRLGKPGLVSGIAGAAYKVMAPHYQRHPITPQEAVHLAEYLATPPAVAPEPRRVTPFLAGGLGAGLAFVGLAASLRRGGWSRRSRAAAEK